MFSRLLTNIGQEVAPQHQVNQLIEAVRQMQAPQMVAPASNGTASTPGSRAASARAMGEPETRHSTSRPASVVDVVDGSDENGQGILIAQDPSIDPNSDEPERGPKERPVHLRIQIKMLRTYDRTRKNDAALS
jgi:hypothetical protein